MEDHLPKRALVLDLKNVLYIDSSGADSLMGLLHTCDKQHVRLVLCGLKFQPLDMLQRCGMVDMLSVMNLHNTLPEALASV